MDEYGFDSSCTKGVESGKRRLKDAEEFDKILKAFMASYGSSLSSAIGMIVVVREDKNPWALMASSRMRGRFGERAEGPVSGSVVAERLDDRSHVTKIFDYSKDRLTGFPCSIEYNRQSIICEEPQELIKALNGVPGARSAYVLDGLA